MILVVTPNPCLDKTLFVDVHKTEGRVEVLRVSEIAGGKGSNVCRVLRELAVPCVHLLPLGGYTGKRVFDLLVEEGIETVPVWVRSPTRVVTTVVDRAWRQIVYFEPPHEMNSEEKAEFLGTLETLQEKAAMVLFCGSVPPSFPEFHAEALLRCRGKKVIIDGRGRTLRELPSPPFGIKMNQEEAEITFGKPRRNLADWEEFFTFFFTQGIEIVILTLGKKGAILGREGEFFATQAPKVQTVNPVGSGDAFLAGFIYGLIRHGSLRDALRFGTAAGACNAMVWEAGKVEWQTFSSLAERIEVHQGKSLAEVGRSVLL